MNHMDGGGGTPTMMAAGWGGRYDLAMVLLKAGADHRLYQGSQVMKLVQMVVRHESKLPHYTPQQKADYQELVQWLESHGESVEGARADIKRWDSWSRTTGEYRRRMDAEIAERKAREKLPATTGSKIMSPDKPSPSKELKGAKE